MQIKSDVQVCSASLYCLPLWNTLNSDFQPLQNSEQYWRRDEELSVVAIILQASPDIIALVQWCKAETRGKEGCYSDARSFLSILKIGDDCLACYAKYD